jgi:hypothetical protein
MDQVKSEDCKAKGNEHFKAGEWPEALKAYSEAIEVRGAVVTARQDERSAHWL